MNNNKKFYLPFGETVKKTQEKKLLRSILVNNNDPKCVRGVHYDSPKNRDEDGSCALCRISVTNLVKSEPKKRGG